MAMVISGSCVAAHNTAIYWALNSLGASTVLISLMATGFVTPFYAVYLTGGGHRRHGRPQKDIINGSTLANCLAFAPAYSSVIAEMVSEEELVSGYTLAGLQMDVSGIFGPLLSARHPSLLSKSISFRGIRHSVVLVARNAGDLRCEGDTPKVPYQLCGFTN